MALVLRTLAACFMFRRSPCLWFYNQASELGCLARSVLSGHGLSSPFCGYTGPSAFLAPGYPLLVSFVYRIFGFSGVRAAEVLVGLQVLCGVAVVALVMLIAKRLFDFRTAYLAGALCAISPTMIWLPALFWETSLSTLFLTGAILLTLHCVDKAQPLCWIALGVYFAAGMLLNPALLLTFIGLGMWATHRRRPHTLWAPLLAAAICIVCFSAWPIRNAMVLHAFIPLRSNLGYELWQGNRSGSQGFFTPETYLNSDRTEYERYTAIGEIAYMQEKKTIAMATIEADPARFVRLSLKRAVVFWMALGGHGISWIVISEITLMSLGVAAALVTLLFNHDEHARVFLIPFLFFPLPYYVTHPDFRFRLVLEPLALLLTAWVLRRAYTKLTGQRAETSM